MSIAPPVAYIFVSAKEEKKEEKRHLLLFGREDGDEVARFLVARSLQRALRKRKKHVERIIRKPTIRTARR